MTNLLRDCVLTYLQCTHEHTVAALTRLPSFMAGFLLFAAARKLPPWSQEIPTYDADMSTMCCHAMSCSKSTSKSMDEKRHAGNKLVGCLSSSWPKECRGELVNAFLVNTITRC